MSQRVERDRAAVRAAAREEAERIAKTARETGEARRARSRAAVEAELERAAAQARQRAEAEAHMVALTTKDTIADEILAQVKARLEAFVREPEFAETLPLLLEEVLADAPGDATVLVPPAHEERCRQWVQEHGGGRNVVADPALRDGVAIQDAVPTFRVTNSLSTRLAKRMDALRKHILARLFPDGAGDA